eukprot:9499955-Pyramimonas_sp.AAC.1
MAPCHAGQKLRWNDALSDASEKPRSRVHILSLFPSQICFCWVDLPFADPDRVDARRALVLDGRARQDCVIHERCQLGSTSCLRQAPVL